MEGTLIRLKGKGVLFISLLYLYLPLVVFSVTWIRLPIGICCVLVAGGLIYSIYKNFNRKSSLVIEIKPVLILLFGVILLAIGGLCGWGGWFPQTADWVKHNAILNDLIKLSWPVYYKNAANPSMLTYNLSAYIIPAVCGKFFHSFYAGEVCMYIWLELGVILTLLNMFISTKACTWKKQLLVVAIFIVFNGCLIMGQQIYELASSFSSQDIRWMIDSDNNPLFQYKSNATVMRWIMPQISSIWLICSIWYGNRNEFQDYVGLMLPAFFSSVLATVGIVYIAIVCLISYALETKDTCHVLKRAFSPCNLVGFFTIGIMLLIYYSGNAFSEKPQDISFHFLLPNLLCLCCFILTEVGLYCILIYKDNKHNGLYWGSLLLLLTLPFVHMGKYNDLQIDANVPAMFLIMMAIDIYLIKNSNSFAAGVLIALLTFSSFNSFKEYKEPFETNSTIVPHIIGDCSYTLEAWSDLSLDRSIPVIHK